MLINRKVTKDADGNIRVAGKPIYRPTLQTWHECTFGDKTKLEFIPANSEKNKNAYVGRKSMIEAILSENKQVVNFYRLMQSPNNIATIRELAKDAGFSVMPDAVFEDENTNELLIVNESVKNLNGFVTRGVKFEIKVVTAVSVPRKEGDENWAWAEMKDGVPTGKMIPNRDTVIRILDETIQEMPETLEIQGKAYRTFPELLEIRVKEKGTKVDANLVMG